MTSFRLLILVAAMLSAVQATARSAAAQASGAISVAARDLPRGATLTAEDIRITTTDDAAGIGEGVAPIGASEVGPGWVTRRVIAEGEPLRVPAVGPPLFIRAGEDVIVVSRRGAIELRLRGRAMGAAGEGDRVTVRIDSRRRLEGIAAAPGLVHIQGVDR